VLGRLFRLAPRLVDLMDFSAREYGLGFARGRVLWALHDSGPVLMRALSQALGVSPRTVTGLIDALEADGWVTRSPHPTDRRATLIALTPVANAAIVRLTEYYRGFARILLGDVPESDLTRAFGVIETVEARMDSVVAEALAEFEAAARETPRPDQ
jgi:DNA-binding MarR family transcriptional regulator